MSKCSDFDETCLKLLVLTHLFRKSIICYTPDAHVLTYDPLSTFKANFHINYCFQVIGQYIGI